MIPSPERIRELHDAHKDAVTHLQELYFSSANDEEREEVLKAKTSIDQTYSSLFASYFPEVGDEHFEVKA